MTNASTNPQRARGEVTTPVIDRKYVQKVKAAHEQRERSLARTLITALATCGTLVGWMLFAKPATHAAQSAPLPLPQATATAEPVPPTAVIESVSSAPIPTVVELPTSMPIPTLMPVRHLAAAPAVVVVVPPTPAPPDQTGVQAVSTDAMPALRVVTMPTAMPMRPPRPGQPDPANPPPNPGGNTGGSK